MRVSTTVLSDLVASLYRVGAESSLGLDDVFESMETLDLDRPPSMVPEREIPIDVEDDDEFAAILADYLWDGLGPNFEAVVERIEIHEASSLDPEEEDLIIRGWLYDLSRRPVEEDVVQLDEVFGDLHRRICP